MIDLNRNGGTSTEVTFHVSGASGAQQACVVGELAGCQELRSSRC